jgi:hypothetical protein
MYPDYAEDHPYRDQVLAEFAAVARSGLRFECRVHLWAQRDYDCPGFSR